MNSSRTHQHEKITIELGGVIIPSSIVCQLSNTPLRIPIVSDSYGVVEAQKYLDTLPDKNDSEVELVELKFSENIAKESQVFFQHTKDADQIDLNVKQIMTHLAAEISAEEKEQVKNFAKTKGCVIKGPGFEVELATLNDCQQVTMEEKSVAIDIPSPSQSVTAQDMLIRKANTMFCFSLVGAASASLWISTLKDTDNFIHVVGSGMFGALPGAMPVGYAITSICNLRSKQIFGDSLFILKSGIPMSFLAGATVGISEVAARSLGYSAQSAKYIAPIVTFTAVVLTRMVAPVVIKKTSSLMQSCHNAYRFFRRTNDSAPTPSTPLLNPAKSHMTCN